MKKIFLLMMVASLCAATVNAQGPQCEKKCDKKKECTTACKEKCKPGQCEKTAAKKDKAKKTTKA